jgi:hypothetical protein
MPFGIKTEVLTERFSRSEADAFDRWPSREAFERSRFCQRRGAFLLRGLLEHIPSAASDFVPAAARAADNMTIEIPRGEVFGFTGTHQALHLVCRSMRRRCSILKLVDRMPGSAARDYDAATVTVAPTSDSSSFSVTVR